MGSDVFNKQVDGEHYLSMAIQPIELTFMLGETCTYCKVAKYITRIKDEPLVQFEKALDCLEKDEVMNATHDCAYLKAGKVKASKLISEFSMGNDLVFKVMYNMHIGRYPEARKAILDMLEEA